MKRFKTIDLCISITLCLSSVVFGLVAYNHYFIIGYFITGGWQLTSMLVHQYKGWFTEKGGTRIKYHYSTLLTLLTVLTGFLAMFLLFPILFLLLFAAPFMAVYYIHVCYEELYVKMQRPLSLLK